MKTENEKFIAARLTARANELIALAAEAAEKTRRADDEYATFDGDADGLQAIFDKRNALAAVQDEAERLAFNAERAAYYANRNDFVEATYYTII